MPLSPLPSTFAPAGTAALSAAATTTTSAATDLRDDDMGSLLLLCHAVLAPAQPSDRSGPMPRVSAPNLFCRRGRAQRRGRDSNPRTAHAVSGFQDRCIRPLCHPSEAAKAIRGAWALGAPGTGGWWPAAPAGPPARPGRRRTGRRRAAAPAGAAPVRAELGELLEARELVGRQLRWLDVQAVQRRALGAPAAQRVGQHVARDPERPGGERLGVVGVAGEAGARLPRAGVGLADEVDGRLAVVGPARQPDQQAPRIAAIRGGEVLVGEAGRTTGHARIFAWPSHP